MNRGRKNRNRRRRLQRGRVDRGAHIFAHYWDTKLLGLIYSPNRAFWQYFEGQIVEGTLAEEHPSGLLRGTF